MAAILIMEGIPLCSQGKQLLPLLIFQCISDWFTGYNPVWPLRSSCGGLVAVAVALYEEPLGVPSTMVVVFSKTSKWSLLVINCGIVIKWSSVKPFYLLTKGFQVKSSSTMLICTLPVVIIPNVPPLIITRVQLNLQTVAGWLRHIKWISSKFFLISFLENEQNTPQSYTLFETMNHENLGSHRDIVESLRSIERHYWPWHK